MTNCKIAVLFFLAGLLTVVGAPDTFSQERVEPELAEREDPLSPYDFDIRNGIGFNFQLNNFGFAIGGEYRRHFSRYSKGVLEVQIANLKDEGEQTFQDFWGYTVIPNKHNRALTFPILLGVNRRVFANALADNFRMFAQFSAGPSFVFVYPYYDHDLTDFNFRLQGIPGLRDQRHYDPFQGWGDGEFMLGGAGHLSIGANMGGDFGNLQTIRIGYYFHYYPSGIQVMEPYRPGPGFNFEMSREELLARGAIVPAADKQYFFGTPHITLVFGSMW